MLVGAMVGLAIGVSVKVGVLEGVLSPGEDFLGALVGFGVADGGL